MFTLKHALDLTYKNVRGEKISLYQFPGKFINNNDGLVGLGRHHHVGYYD